MLLIHRFLHDLCAFVVQISKDIAVEFTTAPVDFNVRRCYLNCMVFHIRNLLILMQLSPLFQETKWTPM